MPMTNYGTFTPELLFKDLAGSSLMGAQTVQPNVGAQTEENTSGILSDIGGLQGISSLLGAVGGIMGARDESKWRERQERREEARVAREERRQEKFESDMNRAWN
ncbi:MAG TPA: hypothetical protein CFH81_08810 [Sulfurovum sp. UBA12169]|nr:MAG TPA: hypothetical protein CFH81_08810 [Sulfurovum sp. UBA12169]